MGVDLVSNEFWNRDGSNIGLAALHTNGFQYSSGFYLIPVFNDNVKRQTARTHEPQFQPDGYLLVDQNRTQIIERGVLPGPANLFFPARGPVVMQGYSQKAKERLLGFLHPGKHLMKLRNAGGIRFMKK